MANDKQYYDGTKILSMLDINSEKPELYFVTTNRTAGKTTYFGRLCVKKFIEKDEQFCLIYRYMNELTNIPTKFFNDLHNLFFKSYEMTSKIYKDEGYVALYLNDKICGYAVALNAAEKIKKCSHIFNSVKRCIFDEFMSIYGDYTNGEVDKFISIHTSMARGNGEMSRYLPVYMLGNSSSLLNPYFMATGVSKLLKHDTKFLRGNGFVLERTVNESARTALKESTFNKAFSGSSMLQHESINEFYCDNTAFIQNIKGGKYCVTLKYGDKLFSMRHYDNGIAYFTDKIDATFPKKYAVNPQSQTEDYPLLTKIEFLMGLKDAYFKCLCRFNSLESRMCLLELLSANHLTI